MLKGIDNFIEDFKSNDTNVEEDDMNDEVKCNFSD